MTGEPVIVSYSELDTYRQCPMKHQWSYRDRYRGQDAGGSRATGTQFHALMEVHYGILMQYQQDTGNASPTPSSKNWDRVNQAVTWAVYQELRKYPENALLLEWMYLGYVEVHAYDPGYRILGIEEKDEVLLGYLSDGREVRLKTRIDLRVENLDVGGMEIWDHKTGKNLSSRLELDLDTQFGLYLLTKRLQGVPVNEGVRNEIRTTMNLGDAPGAVEKWQARKDAGEKPGAKPKPQTLEQRYQRLPLERTDAELAWDARDTLELVENIYASTARVTTSPNPETCKWKCDFLDAHLEIRRGGDEAAIMAELGFEKNAERN